MFSLEPEIEALRPTLGDAAADALIARESREVFSVYPELRVCGWLGATLLASAAGVLLKNNLERLGPLALAVMIGVAAVACYAWTWIRRARATLADDYVLLLGALLVSADVAFIESQFHLLGDAWKQHLLLLAVVHAIGAYAYDSRVLLSLSISALASWFGIERSWDFGDLTVPSLIVAGILIAWRMSDARFHGPAFTRTFEHFAANIAMFGMLTTSESMRPAATIALLLIAALVIGWGFRIRHEPFVLYAFLYAVIGLDVLIIENTHGASASLTILFLSMVGAIVGLLALHAHFRERVR